MHPCDLLMNSRGKSLDASVPAKIFTEQARLASGLRSRGISLSPGGVRARRLFFRHGPDILFRMIALCLQHLRALVQFVRLTRLRALFFTLYGRRLVLPFTAWLRHTSLLSVS